MGPEMSWDLIKWYMAEWIYGQGLDPGAALLPNQISLMYGSNINIEKLCCLEFCP